MSFQLLLKKHISAAKDNVEGQSTDLEKIPAQSKVKLTGLQSKGTQSGHFHSSLLELKYALALKCEKNEREAGVCRFFSKKQIDQITLGAFSGHCRLQIRQMHTTAFNCLTFQLENQRSKTKNEMAETKNLMTSHARAHDTNGKRYDVTTSKTKTKQSLPSLASKEKTQRRSWAGAMVQWLWEETHVPKVLSLNPGIIYWMDIFHNLLL